MACDTKQRVIQGRKYTVTQMPPSVSIPIQAKLVQLASGLAGPMLKDAASGLSVDVAGLAAVSDVLSAAGEVISKYMPGDELLAFAQKLVNPSYVSVEGGPIDFESEFAGDDMVRLYPLIAFILEVNYARFFSGLGLSRVVAIAKSRLQSSSSSDSPPT